MLKTRLYSIHVDGTISSIHLTRVVGATFTGQAGKRRAYTPSVTTSIIPRAGDSIITTQGIVVCPSKLVAAVTVL